MNEPWTPWTIVHKGTTQPVLAMDCAEDITQSHDEALLVFRDEEAARKGAAHQMAWEVEAEPCLLSTVIAAEAAGQTPTEDGMAAGVKLHSSAVAKLKARDDIYKGQGLGGPVGEIKPDPKPD